MPTLHIALWIVAAVLAALATAGVTHERVNLAAGALLFLILGLLIT